MYNSLDRLSSFFISAAFEARRQQPVHRRSAAAQVFKLPAYVVPQSEKAHQVLELQLKQVLYLAHIYSLKLVLGDLAEVGDKMAKLGELFYSLVPFNSEPFDLGISLKNLHDKESSLIQEAAQLGEGNVIHFLADLSHGGLANKLLVPVPLVE